MSSSVLRDRLAELGAAGLVGQGSDERWSLTPLGADLRRSLAPLSSWARRWDAQLRADSASDADA
jgi:DNA-binding HxlR family transcriptional regulator